MGTVEDAISDAVEAPDTGDLERSLQRVQDAVGDISDESRDAASQMRLSMGQIASRRRTHPADQRVHFSEREKLLSLLSESQRYLQQHADLPALHRSVQNLAPI